MKIMKKALYIILLLAELFVGFLLMYTAWNSLGWIPCVITIAVWAGLLAWQIVALTKNSDATKVWKIKRNIALIMLIPSAMYVVMVVYLIVILLGAF